MADNGLIIENYIEINGNGRNVPLESLSKEERMQIASMLQEQAMGYAGYKRVQAPG